MKYRHEIDGLRALAVLPVILFHAGLDIVTGGFLGVDVFFVISGYLITQIILSDIAAGTFSIARFYERRARRILPALFVVMLCCIPFALAFMLPSQLESFSRSLIAVVGFVSNIFFWRESGYFAAAATEKPLLHTWSLGVEEQFYLLFPLVLMVLWRFGTRTAFLAVLATAILGLGLCEFAARYMSSANFFLLPTRAWELMVGALCAFWHHGRSIERNNLLSLSGLGMIVIAITLYDEQMRLPSALSLLPVLGTALILLYGTRDTLTGRLLSLRPLVAIGLVSYSAYLWHHPIFAFLRIHEAGSLPTLTMLGFAALAVLLGAISWYLVEQPFRNKQHRHYVKGRPALAMAVLCAAMLVGAGAYGHITHGRLDAWKANAEPAQARAYELIETERNRDFAYDNRDCVFNITQLDSAAATRILKCGKKYGAGIATIGDSHAMNLFHLLRSAAPEEPFLIGMGQGMCRPNAPLPGCHYGPLLELLASQPALFSHILYEQAGWEMLVDGKGHKIEQDAISGLPLDRPVPEMHANTADMDAVTTYLSKLAAYSNVIWLGPRIEPEITESLMVRLGCDHPFALRTEQERIFRELDTTIENHLAGTPVTYRSQIAMLQFDMRQDFMDCGATYWKDRNHYSAAGELRFGQRLDLKALLAP